MILAAALVYRAHAPLPEEGAKEVLFDFDP